MNIKILSLLLTCALLASCEDLFTPANENNRGLDDMYDESLFAQGILVNGYTRIPTSSFQYFQDAATDNAVTNDQSNDYLKIATGQWTASNNPTERWRNCKAAIQYLNIFINAADEIEWASDETVRRMFNDRLKGEAYALRALFMYYLLEAHGGWTAGGELLGVPIVLEMEDIFSDFNQPRDSFEACMQRLYTDLDMAEDLLPLDFGDLPENQDQIDTKYGTLTKSDYERVFGNFARGRVSGRIAKGIRARAALLAASPAYSSGTTTTWEDVAEYAARSLDLIGGPSALTQDGHTWYTNTSEINNLGSGDVPPEILWRTDKSNSSGDSPEVDNYPPTLYGRGRINPTQNLVDAFPMANGYPIGHSAAGYDPADPYADRDPRLGTYIVVNGSTAGPTSGYTINTAVDGGTNDGLNRTETSTRTGYYMRKLLRQDVNLDPVTTNHQYHYKAHIRYTELFLIYAEAANEAWGPDGTGPHGYSARDVIAAIRSRAGVGTGNGDAYLASITSKDDMRELIRNERRLELCFEGFRFWDLRRWNENLNETANGVSISGNTSYTVIPVENRVYQQYMNHGPVPYSEVVKFSALEQNRGW